MIVYSAVLTDEGYRNMVRLGFMPSTVTCHQCGKPSTFQDDAMAARYECVQGHAGAAMWRDRCVVEQPA